MIREAVILSLGLTVVAQWDVAAEKEDDKRTGHILCGEQLTNTLSLLCGGFYNSPFKKSYNHSGKPEYTLKDLTEDNKYNYRFPFNSKQKALTGIDFSRLKRGVHDECCRQSCSINELRGYCAKRN